ncbi:MAG: hypothetical protein V3U33_06470, partial [candidate division NC10 bacterium]
YFGRGESKILSKLSPGPQRTLAAVFTRRIVLEAFLRKPLLSPGELQTILGVPLSFSLAACRGAGERRVKAVNRATVAKVETACRSIGTSM